VSTTSAWRIPAAGALVTDLGTTLLEGKVTLQIEYEVKSGELRKGRLEFDGVAQFFFTNCDLVTRGMPTIRDELIELTDTHPLRELATLYPGHYKQD
jgi:hypothetical protein